MKNEQFEQWQQSERNEWSHQDQYTQRMMWCMDTRRTGNWGRNS